MPSQAPVLGQVAPAEPKDPVDLSTPEASVASFTRLVATGDMEQLARCFIPGAEDLEDLRDILHNPASRRAELKEFFEAVDPNVPAKIIEVEVDPDLPNSRGVTWLVTLNKPFTHKGQTWAAGDTFELDATLIQIDGEWRMKGL